MARAFFSFYFADDVFRAGQVRNMGVVEGDQVVGDHDWEEVKKGGDKAIEQWIVKQMGKCGVAVVLVGANTYTRKWVNYEIAYAWDNYKPLMGIRIHRLKGIDGNTSTAGPNPFEKTSLSGGSKLSEHVPLHEPSGATSKDVYENIKTNIEKWIKAAPSRKR
jgi:hypothetical protein